MATDYPVPLVDRLPIFVNEACSATILMDMVCGGAPAQDESGDGSRWGIEEAGTVQWEDLVASGVGGSVVVRPTASRQVVMQVAEPCPIRVRVGKHPPDRTPCAERVGALEHTLRRRVGRQHS